MVVNLSFMIEPPRFLLIQHSCTARAASNNFAGNLNDVRVYNSYVTLVKGGLRYRGEIKVTGVGRAGGVACG